jgi:hypothetical protein
MPTDIGSARKVKPTSPASTHHVRSANTSWKADIRSAWSICASSCRCSFERALRNGLKIRLSDVSEKPSSWTTSLSLTPWLVSLTSWSMISWRRLGGIWRASQQCGAFAFVMKENLTHDLPRLLELVASEKEWNKPSKNCA